VNDCLFTTKSDQHGISQFHRKWVWARILCTPAICSFIPISLKGRLENCLFRSPERRASLSLQCFSQCGIDGISYFSRCPLGGSLDDNGFSATAIPISAPACLNQQLQRTSATQGLAYEQVYQQSSVAGYFNNRIGAGLVAGGAIVEGDEATGDAGGIGIGEAGGLVGNKGGSGQ